MSPPGGGFNNQLRANRGISIEMQQGEAGARPALIRNCIAWQSTRQAEPDYLPEFVSGALREPEGGRNVDGVQ